MATEYQFQRTRPRVPISAMFSGPGAARYFLPNCTGFVGHDFSKLKAPAYSFGTKNKDNLRASTTPGPAAYSLEKGLTRNGTDGSEKYSLSGRTKLGGSFQTPAPWDYGPEKKPVMKHRFPPSYSFGSRTPYNKKDNFPGPDTYTMPPVLGSKSVGKTSAPCYSMTGRSKIGSFHEDLQKTPGAGTYKVVDPNVYKNRKPIYSMNARNFAPGDNTRKPGPGAYSPEKVNKC
ncbi:unnamed protein product [Porites evermanni]|uniref:Outer dense fiber protein 3 n=1 Tax=Porites evermanni TaxID=104178 RepID=A0ABN8SYR2_9CNID|nr:unnamed protein product [Porites evermanni]